MCISLKPEYAVVFLFPLLLCVKNLFAGDWPTDRLHTDTRVRTGVPPAAEMSDAEAAASLSLLTPVPEADSGGSWITNLSPEAQHTQQQAYQQNAAYTASNIDNSARPEVQARALQEFDKNVSAVINAYEGLITAYNNAKNRATSGVGASLSENPQEPNISFPDLQAEFLRHNSDYVLRCLKVSITTDGMSEDPVQDYVRDIKEFTQLLQGGGVEDQEMLQPVIDHIESNKQILSQLADPNGIRKDSLEVAKFLTAYQTGEPLNASRIAFNRLLEAIARHKGFSVSSVGPMSLKEAFTGHEDELGWWIDDEDSMYDSDIYASDTDD